MHPLETRSRALALLAVGLNDCEVARRVGIPRSTVRDWRRPPSRSATSSALCPRCWLRCRPIQLTTADYARLLGLYLGDGHIVRMERTERFRLFLDSRYPGIIEEARALMRRCFPRNSIGVSRSSHGTTTILSLYSSHLSCLFPQHGPGKKHERRIALEDWQQQCVDASPWAFLRACIQTDGCAFINRTGAYQYPSYEFRNYSDDIRDLFAHACDLVGVQYRSYATRVRIYRRESVALFATHVGGKA